MNLTVLVNFGMATNLGKGKLNSKPVVDLERNRLHQAISVLIHYISSALTTKNPGMG